MVKYKRPTDNAIFQTFEIIGLPRTVSVQILKKLNLWLRYNGPEWTIARLKAYKTLYISRLAGAPTSTWIDCRSDGTPKGPLGSLFRMGTTRRQRIRSLNALMVYSSISLVSTTKSQWEKFYNSFTRECDWNLPLQLPKMLDNVIHEVKHQYQRCWEKAKYDSPREWCSSPTKYTSVFEYYVGMVRCVESEATLDRHLAVLHRSNEGMPARRFCEIYSRGTEGAYVPGRPDLELKYEDMPTVGSIAVIQERGGKGRFVASPYRVHQMALSRLGNALFNHLKLIDWDYTHDQLKGREFVSEQLRQGRTAHCVDLSDATNNFPLDIQLTVLKMLSSDPEHRESVELLRYLSRAEWTLPKGIVKLFDTPEKIRCTVGQPLGLFPSFAAFALTHGLVIRGIEHYYGTTGTFAVLGDDVVIFDPRVYKTYMRFMADMRIPISEDKSIVSDVIGEFAGRFIDSIGTYPIEKWKGFSFRDPLSVYRWLGHKARPLVPKKFAHAVAVAASMPQPYGLGINPEGLSLKSRWDLVPDDEILYPGRIPDTEAERYRLREVELSEAFSWESPYRFFRPPRSDQDTWLNQVSDVFIRLLPKHIQAIVDMLKYLPDQHRETFDELRRKALRKRGNPEKPQDYIMNKLYSLYGRCPTQIKE